MRNLSVSVAIAALLATAPVYALGGGVAVTGYCKSVGGLIASEGSVMSVSSQITALQGTLATQLHLIGSSIASQEGALISTIDSQFKNENNQIRHSANAARIGAIKAQQALAMAPNQQPQNMCDAPGLGAGIQVGSQTNADLTQKIAAASNTHDTTFTRPIDAGAETGGVAHILGLLVRRHRERLLGFDRADARGVRAVADLVVLVLELGVDR